MVSGRCHVYAIVEPISEHVLVAAALIALTGCGYPTASQKSEITVAAAANLAGAFDEIGRAFTDSTDVDVILSYASTAQLAHQIENSAPFDVFASADMEHVDALVTHGKITQRVG